VSWESTSSTCVVRFVTRLQSRQCRDGKNDV
jgi:hypothetical protein